MISKLIHFGMFIINILFALLRDAASNLNALTEHLAAKHYVLIISIQIKIGFSWKYQTKCTRHLASSPIVSQQQQVQQPINNQFQYNSILEDFEQDLIIEQTNEKLFNQNVQSNADKSMHLKCPNLNDFLFIGLTQYGVSRFEFKTNQDQCKVDQNDCLVTVDYLANQCNGLNSCDIQLDSQFLHSCKNHSDYLTIAYECIPGSQRIDICSNEETFIIDSSQSNKNNDVSLSRFGSFYLSSPNYPNEYSNNLNNCSCKLEYVRIDSSDSQNTDLDQNEMNLVFKAYEFDLEDADDMKCNKDYLRVETEKSANNICGQYKEFKEFYSNGKRLSLGFNTDDVITRRGFLMKISTEQQTHCPFDSKKYDSNKCIKFFGDDLDEKNTFKLNWYEAVKSCQSLNGRLMTVNDFVDDSKINSFIRARSDDSNAINDRNYWLINRKNDTKCSVKRINSWIDEACLTKQAYICEFDAIPSEKQTTIKSGMSDNNGNRLIRVACGSASTLFSNSFKSPESSSTTSTRQAKSNSITNTQKPASFKPSSKASKLSSKILPIISQRPIINIIDYDDYETSTPSSSKSIYNNKEITHAESSLVAGETTKKSIFNQDLVLIIAIACGVSIVLIAINIFCIWNYYNKKLNGLYKNRSNDIIDQTYRSSTLMRSKTSSSSSTSSATNRTLQSTVDSYIKVPAYDLCLVNSINQMEPMSACESLSTSGSESNNEIIRSLLKTQNKNEQTNATQHYYETLSRQHQQLNFNSNQLWNNYAEYNPIHRLKQFDSFVVLPSLQQHNHNPYISSKAVPIVLLAANQQQVQSTKIDEEQQYSSVVYGDLSPSSSSSSSASTSSNQPLITFAPNTSGVSAI